jgi:tetratricopeptide (TPR) repeat protein
MHAPKLALWFVLVGSLAASASAQQVGDRVVVITENAPLHSRETATAVAPKGAILVVEGVTGDRISVMQASGVKGAVTGWVNRSDVLSIAQALDFFNAELKRSPNAPAYATRAAIWGVQGEFDKGIADCNAAIRLDPKNARAFFNRGKSWSSKGDENDKAISDYNAAIRLDPHPKMTYYVHRSEAWWNKREYDKAMSDLDEAIRLDPTYAAAYVGRAYVWRSRGDSAKAMEDCNEATRLDPQYAPAYTSRAAVWSAKGDYNKMIADCTEAIRLDPKFAMAYAGRGYAWQVKRDYDKAISDYTEAIRLDPRSATTYYNRGIRWEAKAEYGRALSDYGEAIRVRPKYMAPWGARAWLEATCPDAKYRDGKKAVEDATKASQLTDGKEVRILETLAAAYAEAGDFPSAVMWQENALELAPEKSKPSVQFRLDLYISHKPYRQKATRRKQSG